MQKQQKFSVYLAGPISGCSNDEQVHQWRNDLKKSEYNRRFDFIDPTELLLPRSEATAHQIVEKDLSAIKEADGLLVNMWRESIGSAIGIVHAHKEGRSVVVADPNNLSKGILEFYADAVTNTPAKAANMLWGLLKAEAWEVIKRGPQREPFKRRKLVDSLRAACRSAKCDDIIVPRLVLPEIIERLKNTRRMGGSLTTSDINNVVVEVLGGLKTDPGYAETAEDILAEWKNTGRDKRENAPEPPKPGSEAKVKVDVTSSKSHATIWGKAIKRLGDIPSQDARRVFQIISTPLGITRIDLGQFSSKDSRRTCGAFVKSSKAPFLIDGKLYDKGKKGTVQTFQVHVQYDKRRKQVENEIKTLLENENRWFDE